MLKFKSAIYITLAIPHNKEVKKKANNNFIQRHGFHD